MSRIKKPGTILFLSGLLSLLIHAQAAETDRYYLSGTGPSDAVQWEFFCTKGRQSGEWTTIPVPSNWEQHGFGNYNYGHDKDKHDEQGLYRYRFEAPKEWAGRVVRIVFEGSMTDTEVKINGVSAGPVHQGAWYEFRLPISNLLKFGAENLLEVTVSKVSANERLEAAERKADFWVHGGIFRPVYLEILPPDFIDHCAIDARADGQFQVDVFPKFSPDTAAPDEITAQIETLDGVPVQPPVRAKLSAGTEPVRLSTRIKRPLLWSDEHPNLYRVRLCLMRGDRVVHEVTQRFGFRTFEVRPGDGLYLNGKKIRIKGINRNSFRPETARALDPEDDREDALAIKAMNANLVRSHLSPSRTFMGLCDELGLFVINELCTWQKPWIDTPTARKLIQEMVTRDVNHPSLLMWANGNEGGFNLEVDSDYQLHDPQARPVIHPWSLFSEIDTKHYITYDLLLRKLEGPNIFLPTEFLHGLYDGGLGAGLEDYWAAIRASKYGAGGVLWCWADAAIVRTDQNNKLDTAGNYSADGLVGPHGEKEASYFTVQTIWSPIQTSLTNLVDAADGKIPLRNEFLFTDLKDCSFAWKLLKFSAPFSAVAETVAVQSGEARAPSIAPGESGVLPLHLPKNWRASDALELTACTTDGRSVFKRVWPLAPCKPLEGLSGSEPVIENGDLFTLRCGDVEWRFSPETGQLFSAAVAGKPTGFSQGPFVVAAAQPEPAAGEWTASAERRGDAVEISAISQTDDSHFSWKLKPGGALELNYHFALPAGKQSFWGIGFDLEESAVHAKHWRGDGPYRVWANRRLGPRYGLWENDVNQGIPGVVWDLPAFSGIFAHVDWTEIELNAGDRLLMVPGSCASDIGILQPPNGEFAKKATWDYPSRGGLFVFHQVPAVGTKFKKAPQLGPQSKLQSAPAFIDGTVTFIMKSSEGNL